MTRKEIQALVDQTPLADTHEHIIEEVDRLQPAGGWRLNDIGLLFSHYLDSDLRVAGMPAADFDEAMKLETPPDRKWALLRPWWARTRNTGYALNLRETVRALYGQDDVTDDNWEAVNAAIGALIRPGYYQTLLKDIAHLDHCQVNSLQHSPFCETRHPDLLLQDISFVPLSTGLDIGGLSRKSGIDVKSLDDWYDVIDWCFATYGPRAIAVKNQSAYARKLDYAPVPKEDAAPVFQRLLKQPEMTPEERKPLEDHLFHHCVDKATEYNLPIKLHTGYYAGCDNMPLHRLRHNAGDMCQLLAAHRKARFVFMHITYPYQSEAIAVAKNHTNCYLDMCWAWIINPAAGVRFLKEFLMAAPMNKVFTFGGDYCNAEMTVGHARIARRGIAQAIAELVEEQWIRQSDVPDLVERLMRGNARETFDVERCLAVGRAD